MSKISISIYLEKNLQKFSTPEAKRVGLVSWYKRMYKFIPFETGLTASNITIEDDGIHFKAPNARFLYYGKLMVSPTTGSSWAKRGETKRKTNINLKYSKEQHPNACAFWAKVAGDLYGDAISKEIKTYILRK